MKKYFLLLVFVCSNIGYTQTLAPKQALYDSLISGKNYRSSLDFLTFSRPVAIVPISPDTLHRDLVFGLYMLFNDVRTDFPYDYYLVLQFPSKSLVKSLDRYITTIGFIWKMDVKKVWVIEIDLHAIDHFRGVNQGWYSRVKFDFMISNSYVYDKPFGVIERN